MRSRVTRSHNVLSTYRSLSKEQRAMELSNLIEFKDELLRFDELIQEIKYADESKIDESEMENEMEACTDYQCKIRECIALLKDISNASTSVQSPNSNTNPLGSLLKQPIAPLPKFSGSENEDLMKFLREFELTASKYNYPDRDCYGRGFLTPLQ